jgi:hypothetical protein
LFPKRVPTTFVWLKPKWADLSDRTTWRDFLPKIENPYGPAPPVWGMDRGIPSEAIWRERREPERQTFYLVGTPRSGW